MVLFHASFTCLNHHHQAPIINTFFPTYTVFNCCFSKSQLQECLVLKVISHNRLGISFREFNLSGAHHKASKQAALGRHEQQQQQQQSDLTFRPHVCSSGRGRSQSVGKQRASGDQRLEQLARPKTAHWDKCEHLWHMNSASSAVTA